MQRLSALCGVLPTELSTTSVDDPHQVDRQAPGGPCDDVESAGRSAIIAPVFGPLWPLQPHEKALLSIIQAAGWPIWPLILCSVVALALAIERLYHLRDA